jgi:hypothetical protein
MSLPADPLKESIEDGCGVGWRWVGINGWKKKIKEGTKRKMKKAH